MASGVLVVKLVIFTNLSIMKTVVYCIRHIESGRVYVGSTVNAANRWSDHKSRLRKGTHPNISLQSSWTTYGCDAFAFEVLEVAPTERLLEREQHWIDSLKAALPASGFNRHQNAASPLGTKRTEEHRAALRAMRKGVKKSPEHIAKLAAAHIGSKRSEETKKKMSAIHKGKTISEEHKARLSAFFKGRTFSPETIAKMNEGRRLARERKLATTKS